MKPGGVLEVHWNESVLGIDDGLSEGCKLGRDDGFALGILDGPDEGCELGTDDGPALGWLVGTLEGFALGTLDGPEDGCALGRLDGFAEGRDDGEELDSGTQVALPASTHTMVVAPIIVRHAQPGLRLSPE